MKHLTLGKQSVDATVIRVLEMRANRGLKMKVFEKPKFFPLKRSPRKMKKAA